MGRKKGREIEDGPSFWLSYSDMMAGLLLMFVIIIAFSMMQARQQVETNQRLATELEQEKETYEKKKKELENKNSELQMQLNKIIGVRTNLIETLKDAFEETDSKVEIDDQTGAIMFDASILFDFNQSNLKPSGQEFLNEFLPQYLSVIMSEKFKPYIAEIIIEGHTDSVGGYISNLNLSQRRALAVASYCLQENGTVLSSKQVEELKPIITANGRSYSNLILNDDGTENRDASRRVEFKFRLKEDEMIEEMKNLLKE